MTLTSLPLDYAVAITDFFDRPVKHQRVQNFHSIERIFKN
jgi:hypothetical protein